MISAKNAVTMPTSATREGRAKGAAMKGERASSPTSETFPPETAKTIATAEAHASATRVATASARSPRSVLGVAGSCSSPGSATCSPRVGGLVLKRYSSSRVTRVDARRSPGVGRRVPYPGADAAKPRWPPGGLGSPPRGNKTSANRHCRRPRRAQDEPTGGRSGSGLSYRAAGGLITPRDHGQRGDRCRDCSTAAGVPARSHRAGEATVVLDLLGVTFLDSTALGVLVGALKRCRELGGELHVVVADPRIVKIFEITGLTSVFTIADSLESAGAA